MRRIIFSLLAFVSVTSLCFAQQAQAPVSQPASQTVKAPVESKTFTGKVELVMVGDPAKGTKTELTVVSDDGVKSSFIVKGTAAITAKDGKAVTLSDIKKDSRVTVEYMTNQAGINKAQSIKLAE
ncbi:MAG TPA: hypothetical protein VMD04_01380 [Candidatus Margulisiibacteriota bacterium]|nr:hypothetical protein [Candidatus Margulisiibacteriota bacterium]